MESRDARSIEDLPERLNAAADLIDHNLSAGRGEKSAVIDRTGPTSYADLADRIARMASAFAAQAILPERRVLLCLLDTIDFPVVFLGAIHAGVIPVPLNTLLVADDYRWILENSGADAVFVSGELAHHWVTIAADFPHVKFFSSDGGHWPMVATLLADADPAPPHDSHRDDVAFWLYTSGSTGRPKGAMHSHASMRLTANLFGLGVVGYRDTDIVLSVAKLFFAYGLGNALSFPLAAGATVVLHHDRATPQAITGLVERHGVTILNGVPTFFAGWFASGLAPSKEAAPGLRIATSAGECLPAHIGEEFRSRYGADILDGLGSTEMLHVFLAQRPGSVRYGCTGRVVPGYQVRIVDDEGRLAAPGELGELHVRGPSVAIGYWRNLPKSRATFQGEWMRTGDKYSGDADGWYSYGGRSDDMLKVGGIYVSPIEVEEALGRHEAVLEAAVIGAADGDGLIKPRAHVVLRDGFAGDAATEAALKAHVKAMLAPYKYPRWIVFEQGLPKTATGKIQRFRLRGTGMITAIAEAGPAESLDVAGVALEVRRWPGSGVPILLLHEGLGSAGMWRDFPDRLAERSGRPVVAWSRQGYGWSDPLPGPYRPDYMHLEADRVPALLDRLGVDRAVLLGHSDGGSIALIAAARFPERVAGLILEAPHVYVEQLTVDSIAAIGAAFRTGDLAAKLGRYHRDAERVFRRWNHIWLDPGFRDWTIERLLPAITAPALLIQGLDDEHGTIDQLKRIQAVLPVSNCLALAACGHAPHRDQPLMVLDAMAVFLRTPILAEGAHG